MFTKSIVILQKQHMAKSLIVLAYNAPGCCDESREQGPPSRSLEVLEALTKVTSMVAWLIWGSALGVPHSQSVTG